MRNKHEAGEIARRKVLVFYRTNRDFKYPLKCVFDGMTDFKKQKAKIC